MLPNITIMFNSDFLPSETFWEKKLNQLIYINTSQNIDWSGSTKETDVTIQ